MIGTKVLEDIITACVFTAYIADEKPLSILLAAEVESGKTELVTMFKNNIGIEYFTDATAYSMWRDLSGQIEAGEIKHIIFPDLLTPFSKTKETVNSFIMFLANMTEEGIAEIHTGFLPEGGIKLSSPTPVGIIAGIAMEELSDRRHRWARAGFMSRMLPVSYRYNEATVGKIKESIVERRYVDDAPIKLNFPKEKVRMALPTDIANEVMKLEDELRHRTALANYTYGFRLLKQLQRLVMGYTLSKSRRTVTWEDFRVLKNRLFRYINLEYNPL